jgi:protein-tyrosine-phosphatase
VILKPAASVEAKSPTLRREVRKIRSLEEIRRLPEEESASLVVLQQNFIGIGVGVELLAYQGEILTALQHERVHEAPNGGISGYRRTVPLDADLLDAAGRLMSALCYTGVCMIEFRRNLQRRDWVLIEINGRFWGSVPLSISAGLDFPTYLYEMLCLGKRQFPTAYTYNQYARNWLIDVHWFRSNMLADHNDPTLLTVPISRVVREFANLLLLRESNDTLKLYDPGPGLAEIRQELFDQLHRRYQKLPFMRLLLERRARTALQKARKVLFACSGNICRSPFAAASMRKLKTHTWECASSGFHPVDGRRSPSLALEAAQELGVSLEAHRSTTITEEIIRWADVVFIFDRSNEKALAAEFPQYLKKVHYLGALDHCRRLEIQDPYGVDLTTFRDSFALIQVLLDEAAGKNTGRK